VNLTLRVETDGKLISYSIMYRLQASLSKLILCVSFTGTPLHGRGI
jgi:hypothetical protein